MQEEKSAVYTVILGVCLLLCLLMLGNMLMGRADTSIAPAAPEEGDAMEFHITEDDIASVLTEALPFSVEDTAVKISRDGTIAVTAAVTRQAAHGAAVFAGALQAVRRVERSCFKRQTQPCLPDHQAGRLHLARADRSGTLRCVRRTVEYPHGTAGLHAADHTVAGRGSGAAGITALNRQKKNPFGKPKGFLVCNLTQKLRGLRPDSGSHSCRSATST